MESQKVRKKPLGLVILDILSNEELHGYGIAERIEEIYGVKRPSSSMIYPLLSELKKKEFVKIAEKGKREKKIYKITEQGKKYLKEHEEELKEAKELMCALGKFHRMGGYELMNSIKLLIENMHEIDNERKEKIEKEIRSCTRKIKILIEFGESDE